MKSRTLNATMIISLVAVTGCASMSGVGGTTEYACPLPQGATCKSVSQTYNDSFQNSPSVPHDGVRPQQSFQMEGAAITTPIDSAESSTSVRTGGVATKRPNVPMVSAEVGTPLLTGPRLMRILIAPWTDNDDNLMEAHRVFVKLDESRWRLDHVKASLYRSYGPITPPAASQNDDKGGGANPTPDHSSVTQMMSPPQQQ